MKVRVRWSETITKEATIEVDDLDDTDALDSVLADVADADCTTYAVDERDVLETEVLDPANVTIPADVKAPSAEGMWS